MLSIELELGKYLVFIGPNSASAIVQLVLVLRDGCYR